MQMVFVEAKVLSQVFVIYGIDDDCDGDIDFADSDRGV